MELIDFQGIINFDAKIAAHLEQFLEEKQVQMAKWLLRLLPQSLSEEISPLTLPRAAEAWALYLEQINPARFSLEEKKAQLLALEKITKELNRYLWELTETLEGSAVEFFQQIDQLPMNRGLSKVFKTIVDVQKVLCCHVETLLLVVQRLEKPLQTCFKKLALRSSVFFASFSWFAKKQIDENISHNLQQTALYLKEQFQAFEKKFYAFRSLYEKIVPSIERLRKFPIHTRQTALRSKLFEEVVELLKLIEISKEKKMKDALSLALKSKMCREGSSKLFRNYGDAIKEALFKTSLDWKATNREEAAASWELERVKVKVKNSLEELKALIETTVSYRHFLLKFDANPYRRSRLGFSEWSVAPESFKSEKLASLIFSLHELEQTLESFERVLEEPFSHIKERESQCRAMIETTLNEMGQPLLSQFMMRKRCESLLLSLEQLNEVGSPLIETVLYVQEILSRAMRFDWKYHVLHEFPLFHRLYHLHLGLIKPLEDPSHALRLERLRMEVERIKKYVEKEEWDSHLSEIEVEMNDMRERLQDFLATVQRTVKEKEGVVIERQAIIKLSEQLLEYRYLFGQFFLFLTSKSLRGSELREQFLFVDQYFESAQHLLAGIKT